MKITNVGLQTYNDGKALLNDDATSCFQEINSNKERNNQKIKFLAIVLTGLIFFSISVAFLKCSHHQKQTKMVSLLEKHYDVTRILSKRSNNLYNAIYGSKTSSLSYYYGNKTQDQTYVEVVNSDVHSFYNIHSHNDEWRAVPLFGALSRNYRSIEADCHYDGYSDIYVGHNKKSLHKLKTLQNMYLGPLKAMLDEINNTNNSTGISYNLSTNEDELQYKGVYYNYPKETLNLFIDIKDKHGHELVAKLLEQLEPLKEYLTYYDYNTKKIVQKPLSITLSGNCPVEYLTSKNGTYFTEQDSNKRYLFIDHNLLDASSSSWNSKYDINEWCVMSSGSEKNVKNLKANNMDPVSQTYGNQFSASNLEGLRAITSKYNLLTRIWDVKQTHSYSSKEDMKNTIKKEYNLPYTEAVNQYFEAMNGTSNRDKIQTDFQAMEDLLVSGGTTLANADDLDFMVFVYNKLQRTTPACKNFS